MEILNRLFKKKTNEETSAPQRSSSSPLASFEPATHVRQKKARGDFHMRVEHYHALAQALKDIPPLYFKDPRLPESVEKRPKSFNALLGAVESYLGQGAMQGIEIVVEIHHELFAYIATSSGSFKYEIAKLNDNSYLMWDFIHDPTRVVKRLYSDQMCAFKVAGDPAYSCREKAVAVSPNGFCIFHIQEGSIDDLALEEDGVLERIFWQEYKSGLKERVKSENYDFRGFRIKYGYSNLAKHAFKGDVDFSGAFLVTASFEDSVFNGQANFESAVFDRSVNFRNCVFERNANFTNTKFKRIRPRPGVSFKGAYFSGGANFTNADFGPPGRTGKTFPKDPSLVSFEGVKCRGAFSFQGARGVSAVGTDNPKVRELLDKAVASERLPLFKTVFTKNPKETLEILFGRALSACPNVTLDEARYIYEDTGGIRGSQLFSGSRDEIMDLILKNLQRNYSKEGFKVFRIEVLSEQSAARVLADFSEFMTPVRVWRSGEVYLTCGASDFP